MNEQLVIKEATTADCPIIENLARAIWPICYANIITKEQIEFMLNAMYDVPALQQQMQQGQQFMIVYSGGVPQGFVSFTHSPESRASKINKLYVLPAKHKRGLGRKLISEAEKAILMAGSTQILLNVNRHNPAVKFYSRCGYQIVEEVDIPIGDFWMNDYVMAKQLVPEK